MKQSSFRVDVQALRALAVMAVVIFHLWPELLPGGYVGVDVFFVISGYLITSHLVNEYSITGKVNFVSFYSRRINRLMPLAITVLLSVAIATYIFLPWRAWESTSQQLISSAIGVQNWFLAAQSVDYFASTTPPSPVQHFWSLSLEEQFYLFWPLLILFSYKLSERNSWFQKLQILPVFVVIFLTSFSFSIFQTPREPSIAYFSTFTHAWEFALGGLVAFLVSKNQQKRQKPAGTFSVFLALFGFSLICYSAFVFSAETEFPGFIALIPVVGVVLVLGAAKGLDTFSNLPKIAKQPILWTGATSYAIYLWHWPPIVILPVVIGHSLGDKSKFAILFGTLVIAYLTTKFIENPLRSTQTQLRKSGRVFALAAFSTFSIILMAGLLIFSFQQNTAEAKNVVAKTIERSAKTNQSCYGASSMNSGYQCPKRHEVMPGFDANFAANDWGGLPGISRDRYMIQTNLCEDFATNKEPLWLCKFGAIGSSKKVAVIGDSHAFAILEPLNLFATSKGYELEVYLHDSCSPQFVRVIDVNSSSCDLWRESVTERIKKSDGVSSVVISGFSRRGAWVPFQGSRNVEISRYEDLYNVLAESGKEVFVVSDVPLTSGNPIPECISASVSAQDPCSLDKQTALGWDPVVTAVKRLSHPRVHLVDFTDSFCDSNLCHSVIGGIIAYRDEHHISGSFAMSLLPELEDQIVLK